MLTDLRYAWRSWLKTPAFTAVAVFTFALGIGATTAIFSFVNGVLLQKLPYPNPDRLVMIWQDLRAQGGPEREAATPGTFFAWQEQARSFDAVSAIRGWAPNLTGLNEPEQLTGALVSPQYFTVLGVPPAHGRTFTPDDDKPSAVVVVIVSHGLWQRRFGGDRALIGRTLTLNGVPHRVIGIMPRGFRPAVINADIWRPDRLNRTAPSFGAYVLRVVARLRSEVSLPSAQAEMSTIARRLETTHPEFQKGAGALLVSLHDQIVGPVWTPLTLLFGAALFVMLIACANVANLLLGRALVREREFAIRAALGAGHGRLVRQLVTESVLLAVVGGLSGLLLAFWLTDFLRASAPVGTPRLDEVGLSIPVLAFALVLIIVTGIVSGLVPAIQTRRSARLTGPLQSGSAAVAGDARMRSRRALIISELAVALTLVVAASLLLQSFLKIRAVDPGFQTKDILSARLIVPPTRYPEREQLVGFYTELVERLRRIPTVRAAGLVSVLPLTAGDTDSNFTIEGRPTPQQPGQQPVAWYRIVSAGYFDVLEMRLARGRFLSDTDNETAPGAVVINEQLARKYWPHENPLGTRIRMGGPADPELTIVGIVKDAKHTGLQLPVRGELFVSYRQAPARESRAVTLTLRTTAPPMTVVPQLRAELAAMDPNLPISAVTTLEQLLLDSLAQPRLLTLLITSFALVALTLAAVGIFGVTLYSVSQRTRELGVRIALGASRLDVFQLIVGDTAKLASWGLLIGLSASLMVSRLLSTVLFETSAMDVRTLGMAAALLGGVALVASYIPARRAMQVDPITALRQ